MSKQHPSTFVQADPARVYEFIEQDLRYAAETLPYAQDDVLRKSNAFALVERECIGIARQGICYLGRIPGTGCIEMGAGCKDCRGADGIEQACAA